MVTAFLCIPFCFPTGKGEAGTECTPVCNPDEWYAPITEDLSGEDSDGELATPRPSPPLPEGPGLGVVPGDAPANHLRQEKAPPPRGEAEDPAHAELPRANPNGRMATRLRRRH